MKILPSSLREKKRYIVFEVACESEPVDRKALLDEIFFATQALVGDTGSSEIGYRLMDFNGSRGIMKVNLNAVELARAAMQRGLFVPFPGWMSRSLTPFTYIDYDARPNQLHVLAFHAFPDELAVVKTQSIFELT